MDGFGGEMDVLATKHLSYRPPLSRETPPPTLQSFQ